MYIEAQPVDATVLSVRETGEQGSGARTTTYYEVEVRFDERTGRYETPHPSQPGSVVKIRVIPATGEIVDLSFLRWVPAILLLFFSLFLGIFAMNQGALQQFVHDYKNSRRNAH